MNYQEKVAFFRKVFEDIPIDEFDTVASFDVFCRMATLAVSSRPGADKALDLADNEWALAALELLCDGSPKAKEYFGRTKERLS